MPASKSKYKFDSVRIEAKLVGQFAAQCAAMVVSGISSALDKATYVVQSASVKTKISGLTVTGLMGVAFAAYGIAPQEDPTKQSLASQKLPGQVTEVVTLKFDATTSNKAVLVPSDTQVDGAASLSSARLDRFLQSEKVRKGETMASLLGRLGVNDPDLVKFIAKNLAAQPFVKMQPGQLVQAEISTEGKILALHYTKPAQGVEDGEVAPGTRISLSRGDEGFAVREETTKLSIYTETKMFTIRSTLAAAADANRVPESVANQVVDLFSDVIDFEKEARRGDRVKVIFETVADPQGLEAPTPGRVVAVEWLSGKKLYSALWFHDPKNRDSGEYYGFDGKSLQKSFLRYPIEFARISSEYSQSRKHPVFQDWRAHKGVDFAAPIGTKVRATGEGVVEFIGIQRGYGNVVTLKHGKYSTVYAHLNEFADGLKEGSKVRQGDVIGFVGRTGWATGPHLHYEFKVDGEHANPLSAELPGKAPLDASNRKRLAEQANQVKGLMAQMGAQSASGKIASFQ